MSNGHGNMEPGGMAMATVSPHEDAARRDEIYREHQLRLQEKFQKRHQQEMDYVHTGTHPHDPAPGPGGPQPYYTSQGQLVYPNPSPYYNSRPQYGLSDFELLETL
ncbi:hypothetical protein BGW38_010787, partial [Lunasporangiospora selenospora]